ncbi:hypothetical protein BLA17378_02160 [Burkholderia aenigmatica]|nr:hypothetical protein BLA17378_02160 [Burkholderia aenigmatica]
MAALGASSYSIYLIYPNVSGISGKPAGLRPKLRTGAWRHVCDRRHGLRLRLRLSRMD